MKKSTYRVLAESMISGQFAKAKLPTDRFRFRQLGGAELKNMIREEFEDAKKVADVKYKELPWGDVELEKTIEWMKALDLKEVFRP